MIDIIENAKKRLRKNITSCRIHEAQARERGKATDAAAFEYIRIELEGVLSGIIRDEARNTNHLFNSLGL